MNLDHSSLNYYVAPVTILQGLVDDAFSTKPNITDSTVTSVLEDPTLSRSKKKRKYHNQLHRVAGPPYSDSDVLQFHPGANAPGSIQEHGWQHQAIPEFPIPNFEQVIRTVNDHSEDEGCKKTKRLVEEKLKVLTKIRYLEKRLQAIQDKRKLSRNRTRFETNSLPLGSLGTMEDTVPRVDKSRAGSYDDLHFARLVTGDKDLSRPEISEALITGFEMALVALLIVSVLTLSPGLFLITLALGLVFEVTYALTDAGKKHWDKLLHKSLTDNDGYEDPFFYNKNDFTQITEIQQYNPSWANFEHPGRHELVPSSKRLTKFAKYHKLLT